MGQGSSKSANAPNKLNEIVDGLRDEVQAKFDDFYNKDLAENAFAKNASALSADAGIFYQGPCFNSCSSPKILVLNKGNRASDIALHSTYEHFKASLDWRIWKNW